MRRNTRKKKKKEEHEEEETEHIFGDEEVLSLKGSHTHTYTYEREIYVPADSHEEPENLCFWFRAYSVANVHWAAAFSSGIANFQCQTKVDTFFRNAAANVEDAEITRTRVHREVAHGQETKQPPSLLGPPLSRVGADPFSVNAMQTAEDVEIIRKTCTGKLFLGHAALIGTQSRTSLLGLPLSRASKGQLPIPGTRCRGVRNKSITP